MQSIFDACHGRRRVPFHISGPRAWFFGGDGEDQLAAGVLHLEYMVEAEAVCTPPDEPATIATSGSGGCGEPTEATAIAMVTCNGRLCHRGVVQTSMHPTGIPALEREPLWIPYPTVQPSHSVSEDKHWDPGYDPCH